MALNWEKHVGQFFSLEILFYPQQMLEYLKFRIYMARCMGTFINRHLFCLEYVSEKQTQLFRLA